ncbi:MAG TPA: hypothetical protein VFN45_04445 [Myxococcaceae bacterium]|jgi:hypothetical protein|nr:hypothetical protein [Myxococcaceae bacterium]
MRTRLLRMGAVLTVALLGLACGGGSMDEPAAAAVDLASHSPAAAIVCTGEDPCPKGYICLSGTRCAKTCHHDSDCPSGQACTGQRNGRKFCQ